MRQKPGTLTTNLGKKKGFALQERNKVWCSRIEPMGKPLFYNKFTYEQANAVCAAYGARLATFLEVQDAYNNGANWTNYGWSQDGMALFPIQYDIWNKYYKKDNVMKVRPGINGGYFNKNMKFGVNCYGVKPEPKNGELVKELVQNDSDIALQAKIAEFQKNINNISIAPFNANQWSR